MEKKFREFSPRVQSLAMTRQRIGESDSGLYYCALCRNHNINPIFNKRDIEGGWYAIPHNPNERKNVENCMIVCQKCYHRIS
jgi:hypothetical protein